MGDYSIGTPWSDLTPPRLPNPAQMETDINMGVFTQAGLDKIAATMDSRGDFNVMDYGALGNGSADDVLAIQAAIDAAGAAPFGGQVFFPPGLFMLSGQIINPYDDVHLVGSGQGATTLRMLAGANIGYMVRVGPSPSGTQVLRVENTSLRDMTIDGNKAGQTSGFALVRLFNVGRSTFRDLTARDSFGRGFFVNGRTNLNVPSSRENRYTHIQCLSNRGGGFYFRQLKLDQLSHLYAEANGDAELNLTAHGFNFDPWIDTTAQLSELTQFNATDLVSDDNGGDGFRMAGITKANFTGLTSRGNNRYGVHMVEGAASVAGSYANGQAVDLNGSNWIIRNNALGQIVVDEQADWKNSSVTNIWMQATNQDTNTDAVNLRGVANVRLSNVYIVGAPRQSLIIQDGTPNGGSGGGLRDCNGLTIDNLRIQGGGSSFSSGTPHTVDVLDGTKDLTLNGLFLSNLGTTTANLAWELNYGSSVLRMILGGAIYILAADNGRDVQAQGSSPDEIGFVSSVRAIRGDINSSENISSATSINPRIFANVLIVSGTTEIETLTPGGWAAGRRLTLVFTDAVPAGLKGDGTGNINIRSDLLAGGSWVAAQNDSMTLVSRGNGDWYGPA